MQLYITHAQVEPDEVALYAEKLEPYTQRLKQIAEAVNFNESEASINLPSDLAQREIISALNQELEGTSLKYIFLIGIGGSDLGTKAIYDAMFGYRDVIEKKQKPQIIFVDTNDKTLLESVINLIDSSIEKIDEFLVVTISKSGGTTETITNTEIVLQHLTKKYGESIFNRVVGITSEGSEFEKDLQNKSIRTLHIPKQVGGRFSVFSPAGLFPLLAAHIDIDELLLGALDMRNKCLQGAFSENLALQSAIVLYISANRNQNINTSFIFHPELESLGKWYRQLIAESVGKKEDLSGNSLHSGITPEVSIGSTDLHSMVQLYLGGPNDKITTFINTLPRDNGLPVGKERLFPNVVPEISNKTSEDTLDAIYKGVKIAYEKGGRPYMEVLLDDLSLYEIGAFMQFKMLEIMFLGSLFNVNTFNQPSVENYKIETRKILKGK